MTKKITKLTKAQEDQLTVVRDKWLKVGLDTSPLDRLAVRTALDACYRQVGKEPPRFCIFLDSPFQVGIAIALLRLGQQVAQVSDQVSDQVRDQVSDQVYDQVYDQVSDQVSAQVSDQVRDQVSAQVYDQVRDQVRAQVYAQVSDQVSDQVSAQVYDQVRDQVSDQVYDQVYDQVSDQVSAQVYDQVSDQVSDQVYDQVSAQVSAQVYAQVSGLNWWWWYGFGQFEAYWHSHFDYMGAIGIDVSALRPQMELTLAAGWSTLFWDWAFISAKPVAIRRNERHQLHADLMPALEYPDGFSIYALNGIRMAKEYVLTPAEDLDPKIILSETNVDIRRELLRKIGLGRVIGALGATVLDTWGDYTLYRFNHTGSERVVLKMRNQSIHCWHLEYVAPECKTVAEALHWRKPDEMRDIPVSDDGEDYFAHGDVHIWPIGAKSLKPLPSVRT